MDRPREFDEATWQAATEWLLRVHDLAPDADVPPEFADWLAASEANADAYEAASRVWVDGGRALKLDR